MKSTLVPVRPNGKMSGTDLLRAELEQANAQKGHLLAMFMALLMEHHQGGVNIKIENCNKYQGYGLNYRPLDAPLNDRIRVCVVDPKTNLPISADAPALPLAGPAEMTPAPVATQEPEPEPEPNVPTAACTDVWHTDPNAMGRRCLACGSAARGV